MKQTLQKKLERYTKSISQQSLDPTKISKIGLTSAAAMAAIVSVPVELNSQVVCGDQGAPIRSLNNCVDDLGGFGYTNYCAQFDFDGDGVDELQVRYYNYNGVFPLASMYVDPLTTQFWTVELSTYFPFANFPETPTLRTDAYFTEYGDKMHIFPLSGGAGFGFIAFDGDAHSWFDNQDTQAHPITGQFICCYDIALTSMWGSTTNTNFVNDLVISSPDDIINCGSVLPVEFSKFEATAKDNAVILEWTTESEVNNAGFAIERSMDGKDFREIAFVDGVGESTKTEEYTFNDDRVDSGTQYYYRLRQIDYDGRYNLSDIKVVSITNTNVNYSFGPNPVSNFLSLEIEQKEEATSSIQILDKMGKVVIQKSYQLPSQREKINLDFSGIQSGIYFMKIEIASEYTLRR